MQLGMPVPADEFTASPADTVCVHFPIGAEDTIDKGRLGEECVRLASVFDEITEKSLVLLDESFSSTGAYEASHIAEEVLLGFSKVGCRVIFSVTSAASFFGQAYCNLRIQKTTLRYQSYGI